MFTAAPYLVLSPQDNGSEPSTCCMTGMDTRITAGDSSGNLYFPLLGKEVTED